MDNARALVIDFGDVGGLVALAVAERPDRLVCWHPRGDGPAGQRRRKAAGEHAALFKVECYEEFPAAAVLRALGGPTADARGADPAPPATALRSTANAAAPRPGPGGLGDDPLRQSILLLAAADAARRHRCEEIIWPIHCGDNFDLVCDTCERLIVLQQLIRGAAPAASGAAGEAAEAAPAPAAGSTREGPRRIRAPFLDFNDAQMVDLLVRSDAPLRTAWWCEFGDERPCGRCAACARWHQAFAAAGVAHPWEDLMSLAG